MPVSVTVEGRNRFSVNVRYPRELRQDVDRLKEILIPLPAPSGKSSGAMPTMGALPLFTEPPLLLK